MYRKMKAQSDAENESGALQLETMGTLRTLPVVEMMVNQTAEMYDKVKGSSGVANWTLSTGEAVVNKVVEQAAPITKRLETPIHLVDQTLVRGITTLKQQVPMVCEEPHEIYAHAKGQMNAALGYGADTASSIKTYGWNKANDVLNTKWGSIALSGFGMTAGLADKYIDHYLPESNGDLLQIQGVGSSVAVPDQGDKVSATLETVGRLSSKVQHRLHQALVFHFQTLKQHSDQSIVSLSNIKQIMSVSVEPMTTKMSDLWKELSTEEEGEVHGEEQRSLLVARRLAQRVATFCTSLPKRLHNMLPVTLAEQMDQAAAYATSLYESLLVCEKGGVSDSVRTNVTEQVTKVQNSLQELNSYSQQLMDAFVAKNRHLAEVGESKTAFDGENEEKTVPKTNE